ncbi:hypothetical protein RP726_03040 [Candidatus Methylospira mobilis]|uniref:hypothetical protein n=1 Tax=Candidatus Methylospira mobilis TaxID=1808979 RepID=UPI0028E3B9EA|nr:hypothetical protein [Candidatus Methylospira mobilis]WNV05397.1 hypothetical protein RP726_03040 [Candidatus Methylospira mobilis]
MPIYPDEIAFRMQLGRYIQDHAVVEGLYSLCDSNVRMTPVIFIIPAWLLSWVDMHYSPVEMRWFPFAAVLTAILLTVRYAVQGFAPYAAVIVTSSLAGVAGSGLILARYEYIQTINLICCLGAINLRHPPGAQTSVRHGLFALLLLSGLFSIYAHIQGLLFLPLTFYLAYRIVNTGCRKPLAELLMLPLFGIMVLVATRFHHATCTGFPEIERFWADMTFARSDFDSIAVTEWIKGKVGKYIRPFLYNEKYDVDYLPGIGMDYLQGTLPILNFGITVVLSISLMLTAYVGVSSTLVAIRVGVKKYLLRVDANTISKHAYEHALIIMLFALPVVFLFVYDRAQNFYRSFFINFVAAILSTLWLSRKTLPYARIPVILYLILCGTVAFSSLAVNSWWFKGAPQKTEKIVR